VPNHLVYKVVAVSAQVTVMEAPDFLGSDYMTTLMEQRLRHLKAATPALPKKAMILAQPGAFPADILRLFFAAMMPFELGRVMRVCKTWRKITLQYLIDYETPDRWLARIQGCLQRPITGELLPPHQTPLKVYRLCMILSKLSCDLVMVYAHFCANVSVVEHASSDEEIPAISLHYAVKANSWAHRFLSLKVAGSPGIHGVAMSSSPQIKYVSHLYLDHVDHKLHRFIAQYWQYLYAKATHTQGYLNNMLFPILLFSRLHQQQQDDVPEPIVRLLRYTRANGDFDYALHLEEQYRKHQQKRLEPTLTEKTITTFMSWYQR
jgi:hypothetical protein